MPSTRAQEMREMFKKLPPNDQIHIAIERECKTLRGMWRASKRYSREKIAEHEEWRESHTDLLALFNLFEGELK